DIPIQLKDWIDQYSKEINQIRVDNLTSKDNELKWNNILKNKFSVYKNNYYYQYGPYIDHIKWNQNSPWNEKCPEHPDGPGGHCYAGCAAVAMAQVMKYMEYPKVYDWDSMENTTCGIEIQVLLYDCGVSVDMNYGPESSSASIGDVDDGLIDEFDYSPSNVTYLQRKNSSLYSWRRNIGDDLRIRKTPIIYSGENNDGSASHAFVLDGYKLYTGYNWEYHFNFGWSGSWNGWFKLDCIEPGEHNYNYNQSAVFKIIPSTRGKEEFETVENEIPEVMNLPQNYPNPFNPETTISFTATESTKITEITIYNNNGQKVNTLVSKILPAGEHSVVWNGTDNTGNKVSSGIYYYKMTNGKFTDIKKMLMIK
ncbi:MAG: C10 family peptidase, partial [Bacteroidetes bacterium]|nr:C10 family peptidase [Bacteroidota bacterium]